MGLMRPILSPPSKSRYCFLGMGQARQGISQIFSAWFFFLEYTKAKKYDCVN